MSGEPLTLQETSGPKPPILGVLGGMGPLATNDFLGKLIALTPAHTDQEHVATLVRSVPQISDRSAHILGQGPSPLPAMHEGVRLLVGAGVTRLAIPCNTAHFWYPELAAASAVPIFHIVDCVARRLPGGDGKESVIGVLGTAGMLTARIYQDRLAERGHVVLEPDPDDVVRLVMPGIHGVKAGDIANARILLWRAASNLLARGADYVVMGCTEIPVALADPPDDLKDRLIDPTVALAAACVAWWRGARDGGCQPGDAADSIDPVAHLTGTADASGSANAMSGQAA